MRAHGAVAEDGRGRRPRAGPLAALALTAAEGLKAEGNAHMAAGRLAEAAAAYGGALEAPGADVLRGAPPRPRPRRVY